MHSHDRTLLAQLGFSDPDKKIPLHDMACAYLAETEQAQKLVDLTVPWKTPPDPKYQDEGGENAPKDKAWWSFVYDTTRSIVEAHSEVPISKGCGQYQSIVGFADVVVDYSIEGHNIGVSYGEPINCWERIYPPLDFNTEQFSILVEVKITPSSVGDVIRQMKLYSAHRYFASMILATTYPVSQSDAATLKREGARHVRLGDGFKAWCQRPAIEAESVQF